MSFKSRMDEDRADKVLVVVAAVLLLMFWIGMWAADASELSVIDKAHNQAPELKSMPNH